MDSLEYSVSRVLKRVMQYIPQDVYIQACLSTKINPVHFIPQNFKFDVFVDPKIANWQPFAGAKTFDLFRIKHNSLIIATPRVTKDRKVVLMGKTIVAKALELIKHAHLLLLIPLRLLDSINSKLGQVQAYEMGYSHVALFRQRGDLIPKLLSCVDEYMPEQAACSTVKINYWYTPNPCQLKCVPLPSVVEYKTFLEYTQQHWRRVMQCFGRQLLSLILLKTIGSGASTSVYIDQQLADAAAEGTTYLERVEWTVGYLGAIFYSLHDKVFGHALAMDYAERIMPMLTNREELLQNPDYAAIVRFFCAHFQWLGAFSQLVEGTATLEITSIATARYNLCEGTKSYCVFADTPERAANACCELFLRDIGHFDALRALLIERESVDFATCMHNLVELKYNMQQSMRLTPDHIAFICVGEYIYSCTLVAAIGVCALNDCKQY